MRIKNTGTLLLAFTATALLVLLALRVRIAPSADAVAVIVTTGITCGNSADRIVKEVQRDRGVAATETDQAGGRIIIGFDSGITTPEALVQRVRESGFGATVQQVLTAEQFRRISGREMGMTASDAGGCCGRNGGGCSSIKPKLAQGD